MTTSSENTQVVATDQVVGIKYVLTNPKGEVIDKTEDEPLEYLHGHSNLIIGLEKALEGHKVGDKFTVTVAAKDAYGEVDPERIFEVSREELGSAGEPKVGMMARLSTNDGMLLARIVEVTPEKVVFDANNRMAGVDLTFQVEITSLRPGTAEEIERGGLHSSCSGDCGSCGGCH